MAPSLTQQSFDEAGWASVRISLVFDVQIDLLFNSPPAASHYNKDKQSLLVSDPESKHPTQTMDYVEPPNSNLVRGSRLDELHFTMIIL